MHRYFSRAEQPLETLATGTPSVQHATKLRLLSMQVLDRAFSRWLMPIEPIIEVYSPRSNCMFVFQLCPSCLHELINAAM